MVGLLLCLAAVGGWARQPDLTPIPDLPPSLLVDRTGLLDEHQQTTLALKLGYFQHDQRAQVAILVVREIKGETLAQYGLRVAEAWRLGRAKRDDGLLILVVPSLPAARIEVGYGLEGAIPDALASRWLEDFLPFVREGQMALGLELLLDQVDHALPPGQAKASFDIDAALKAHPEWIVAVVLTALSVFALFPMLLFDGRWNWIATSLLLAACLGGAAFALWGLPAGLALAGGLLPLPYFWRLIFREDAGLAAWQRVGRALASGLAVLLVFAIATLLVRAGLIANDEPLPVWTAPIFGGLAALIPAGILFRRLGDFLSDGVGGTMFFLILLPVAYLALSFFRLDPLLPALAVAGIGTAGVMLMLYLDSHGHKNAALWFCGLAVLAAVPFALFALWVAITGDDAQQRLLHAAAGGGTLLGAGWLAARVGLGGLFGGGGAGR
jgi:uncharacterized protein